jgi:HlyD family secretion protein
MILSAIFRKVSLERLSSPEQLDQMVQVTDPRGWIALAGLGALLLAAIVWGIWGSIPTEAQGDGILLRQGGISDLVANATGQVQEMLVSVGDVIEKGQPVARIQQDALLRQIADDRSKLAILRAQYDSAVRISQQQKRLLSQDTEQQRANLQRTIESLEKDVSLLRERLDAQQGLLNEGLITKETFITTQQSLNAKLGQNVNVLTHYYGLDLEI